MTRYKVATIKLWFSDETFDLSKITAYYIERVLRQKGILTTDNYEIDVKEEEK